MSNLKSMEFIVDKECRQPFFFLPEFLQHQRLSVTISNLFDIPLWPSFSLPIFFSFFNLYLVTVIFNIPPFFYSSNCSSFSLCGPLFFFLRLFFLFPVFIFIISFFSFFLFSLDIDISLGFSFLLLYFFFFFNKSSLIPNSSGSTKPTHVGLGNNLLALSIQTTSNLLPVDKTILSKYPFVQNGLTVY